MERIIEIICDICNVSDITPTTRLLDDHIINSFAIISLVSELNDEFDVEIEAVDIVPDNFQDVESISKLIERLQDEE